MAPETQTMIRRAIPMLCAALIAACTPADPADLFEAGRYEDARREYLQALRRSPGAPVVHYDLGATALRMGEYEAARPHLEAAAADGDRRTRQWAYYNLGNSYLEPVVRDSAEDRLGALTSAIVAYKRALLVDPEDGDAKWNLELARRLLEEEMRSPRPRPQPSEGGGGGGGGGEGGGGGSDVSPGGGVPLPTSGSAGGAAPRMTRAEAEQLLDSLEEREVGLQREKLSRPQPRVVSH